MITLGIGFREATPQTNLKSKNLALLGNEIIQFKSEKKYCIKLYDESDNIINTYYTNKQEM